MRTCMLAQPSQIISISSSTRPQLRGHTQIDPERPSLTQLAARARADCEWLSCGIAVPLTSRPLAPTITIPSSPFRAPPSPPSSPLPPIADYATIAHGRIRTHMRDRVACRASCTSPPATRVHVLASHVQPSGPSDPFGARWATLGRRLGHSTILQTHTHMHSRRYLAHMTHTPRSTPVDGIVPRSRFRSRSKRRPDTSQHRARARCRDCRELSRRLRVERV
jgi:hypothetical protein